MLREMRRTCLIARALLVAGQCRDDGLELRLDLAAERDEDRDHAEGDEAEDDSVLGHRLALLALPVGLDPVDEKRSEHLNSFWFGAAVFGPDGGPPYHVLSALLSTGVALCRS